MKYTLLSDGTPDRALLPIIEWVLVASDAARIRALIPQFADLREVSPAPRSLEQRARAALKRYPCDLLFVHRDAEEEPLERRVREIRTALLGDSAVAANQRFVPVVPVRMTEARLLIDERALRQAAGNPNGTRPVELPAVTRLDRLPDPKAVLERALETASEKTGRRLKRFQRDLPRRIHRVAELIDDFEPLTRAASFPGFPGKNRNRSARDR